MSSLLLSPIQLRDLQLKNRIVMAPMCQYSAIDGVPNDWHLTHLGARAQGGTGLIIVEATGVVPEGRITDQCLGIYNDEQKNAFKRIVDFVHSQNCRIGIQLAHSGRKGTGSFMPVAPSPFAFSDKYKVPHELSIPEIQNIVQAFVDAAKRAREAGFDLVEIHMAHGYLMHEFLSPYSNHRTDEFGGSLQNRMRFPLMVAQAIREFWPQNLPVFARISATDWNSKSSWNENEAVVLCQELKKLGIDLIDVSSGGNLPDAVIPNEKNYQVPFAEKILKEVGIPTGAVGLITEAKQAEQILLNNQASVIILGRALLRNPHWAIDAALALDQKHIYPKQYARGYQV